MWWAGTEARSLEIFLSRRGWSACRGGALIHAESQLGEGDVLPSLSDWLALEVGRRWWSPARVAVFLSGALCRPFLLPELPALLRHERQLAIDAAAKKRTGLAGDLKVWLSPMLGGAEHDGSAHQLGAAVPADILRDLVGAIRWSNGLALSSVQPLWSLALQAALSDGEAPDMLLVRDPESVSIFAGPAEGTACVTEPNGSGFAAAVTVEASYSEGLQRKAILRLISGLDHEPLNARQFILGSVRQSEQAADSAQAASKTQSRGASVRPLADLWNLEAIDLATA